MAVAAFVGLLGIGVSLVLFIFALRHLGTARTGAYFSLAPFIGAVIAIALLHDPLTLTLMVSGTLMAFGLWIHLAELHDHEYQTHARRGLDPAQIDCCICEQKRDDPSGPK